MRPSFAGIHQKQGTSLHAKRRGNQIGDSVDRLVAQGMLAMGLSHT